MKKLLFLLMVSVSVVLAGRPTPRVDTIGVYNGNVRFMATWIINVSTTADTLYSPFPGSIVEIVHNGATTGDTVWVAYQQTKGTPGFTEILTKNRDVAYRDFSYQGKWPPSIYRIIVKGSGTIAIWVRIYS